MATKLVNTANDVLGFAGTLVEGASSLPNRLRHFADDLNDEFIKIGQSFERQKRQTIGEVESNLKAGKIESIGNDVAGWLSEPMHLIIAFLGLVGAIILIRK